MQSEWQLSNVEQRKLWIIYQYRIRLLAEKLHWRKSVFLYIYTYYKSKQPWTLLITCFSFIQSFEWCLSLKENTWIFSGCLMLSLGFWWQYTSACMMSFCAGPVGSTVLYRGAVILKPLYQHHAVMYWFSTLLPLPTMSFWMRKTFHPPIMILQRESW